MKQFFAIIGKYLVVRIEQIQSLFVIPPLMIAHRK